MLERLAVSTLSDANETEGRPVPGPVVGAGTSGPNPREWWPSRVVATAAEDGLTFRHNAQVVCGGQRLPNNRDL